ncbi:MAG: DUF4215 domain-containing protein [Myxococcales bacterium]|nr:DUF4215 domain-containing protein [Myxococcales bacterium]MCB9568284.1 DUF4215 domain-containing protein [Myxococcales bacterium]MCB9705007.1 DUF4215 domain-containing protein [Myxococcales bacterium]
MVGARGERLATALALASASLSAACLVPHPFYVAPEESEASSGSSDPGTSSTSIGSTSVGSTTLGETTSDGGSCGDGVVDLDEECDDGPKNGSDASKCTVDCTLQEPVCGNGFVETGEECDDGNVDAGDGCDPLCKNEPAPPVCGDGAVEGDEACDDGNLINDDGCDDDCVPSAPGICGDGVKAWDELCDDGNLLNSDGCEDDCTPTPDALCQAADKYISCDVGLTKGDPGAPFRALGLGCSDKNDESILIAKAALVSNDPNAWGVGKAFGTYQEMGAYVFGAREGGSLLVLSNGVVSPPVGGVIVEPAGSQGLQPDNLNPDDDNFLPGYQVTDDMSGVLAPQWAKGEGNPNDKIHLTFSTKTPLGAKAYSLDLAFFSSEWPAWVETVYSDILVIWEVSEGYVGDVAIIQGKAMTSSSLHPHWSQVPVSEPMDCENFGEEGPGYSCSEPQLMGTGFEGHAGTRWLRLNRPVTEDSEVTIYVMLADMYDAILNSVVLVDRFRYLCEPCIPLGDPLCEGPEPSLKCCGIALPL